MNMQCLFKVFYDCIYFVHNDKQRDTPEGKLIFISFPHLIPEKITI